MVESDLTTLVDPMALFYFVASVVVGYMIGLVKSLH